MVLVSCNDWLLTALQSDDTDVASHALLRLWQKVQRAQAEPTSRAALAAQFATLPTRAWRRLGLLLFTSDALSVRVVVSIVVALTVPDATENRSDHDGDDTRRPVQQRVWQSDWRQFLHDKLLDTLSRTERVSGISENATVGIETEAEAELALRLVLVVRAVFFEAVRSGMATPKDQVQTMDVLMDAARSPLDAVACVALESLHVLLRASPEASCGLLLDDDVRAYLHAPKRYGDLAAWLDVTLVAGPPERTTRRSLQQPSQGHNSRSHRYRLTFDVLIAAARASADVAVAIVGPDPEHPSQLLALLLRVAEGDHAWRDDTATNTDLSARALELLAVVLRQLETSRAKEFARAVRLSGALISVVWLMGHTARAVRRAALAVFTEIARLSPPRDLARVLVEQGCVVVAYTLLSTVTTTMTTATTNDESHGARSVLQWVVRQLEADDDDHVVQSLVASVRRSTNAKLQRNVVLSLLLLSQSSVAVHDALVGGDHALLRDVVHDAQSHATGFDLDFDLASSLLAAAVLVCDQRSTLKLDAVATATTRRASFCHDALASPSLPVHVTIVCASGEHVVVDDPTLLTAHCKVFARELLLHRPAALPSPVPAVVTLDVRDHEAATVRLFVRLLALSPAQAAYELQSVDRRCIEQLLSLAKAVECAKGWHAATHAISSTLDAASWRATLALAVKLRHPALLLRTLRAAITTSTAATPSSDTAAGDRADAALLVWRALTPECI